MRFLSEIQDESITEDALKSIVRMCQYMHSSVIDASDLFLKVRLYRLRYTLLAYLLEIILGDDIQSSDVNLRDAEIRA